MTATLAMDTQSGGYGLSSLVEMKRRRMLLSSTFGQANDTLFRGFALFLSTTEVRPAILRLLPPEADDPCSLFCLLFSRLCWDFLAASRAFVSF